MLTMRAALIGAALGLPMLAVTPAWAQANQFGSDVQHFFEGMTPNGSMRQAYEAGRHDERAVLLSQRDRWCSPQTYNARPYGYTQPYGSTQPYGGPYASR